MKSHYPGDPRGKHVRIYCTLLHSPAWRCLSWSARALFVDLRASLGKTNNGDLSATLSALKHHGWSSPATLAGALYELQALGFLECTRRGGVEFGSKVCSLYAFTDEDVLAFPAKGIDAHSATHPYKRFASVAEAQAALKAGVAALREQAMARKAKSARKTNGKTTLQKLKRTATETVAVTPICATETEADEVARR